MKKKLNCILLVDDDNVTNFLHKKILKEAALAEQILVALNGEEALTIIHNAANNNTPQPEIIFLDINYAENERMGIYRRIPKIR